MSLRMVLKVRCGHCGYVWNYKGKMAFATCPSCRKKTPAEECEEEREDGSK